MWECQKHELQTLALDKDTYSRCSDQSEPLTGFSLPRGHGGVSILWPSTWSSRVKKVNEGNERIIAIELSGETQLCIINVYLPTNNTSVNSHIEYAECLDIIDNIITKYRNTHKVILVGDMNGTLLPPRPYNKHDSLIQNFVKEQGLETQKSTQHTFFHHSGNSSSQIDYILATDIKLLYNLEISGKDSENTSSHVKVSAMLRVKCGIGTIKPSKNLTKTVKKLKWEKIDQQAYIQSLEMELTKSKQQGPVSVDQRLSELNTVIHKATERAVPTAVIKLKGPKWKASPKVKKQLEICKQKYKLWVASGKCDNILRKDNILAKRELRKQLRNEKLTARKNFYNDLMKNPSTDKFYQLIRRNKGDKHQYSGCFRVDDKEIYSPNLQRNALAKYYEDLATPKDKGYDSAYLELCSVRHRIIEQICKESPDQLEQISTKEVRKAINSLNNKKAADEFGLSAEHLKYSGPVLVEEITNIFNQILKSKTVPDAFKCGILTPVLKKSKDPTMLDNYRGITVTPILGKLFESVLLPRLSETFEQSSLQFGFTKGLSPVMSALIVSEARAETKLNTCKPLFLVTLDSQKAFDVVNHVILLDKLYEMGIHPTLWTIVKDLYSGLTSRVKWLGELSDHFGIHQGVRQGAILSPFLYKTYINPCLVELKEHKIGLFIGTTYCGCPTCADDLALLSDCENELQVMANVVKRHSKQDHVTIHPDKSNAVLLNKPKSYPKKSFSLELSEKTISLSTDTTHLGLLRSECNENIINIEERLKLARRTLYALINTGVHGSNGINPRVSYKIYQCYVLPRLLFGLEVLPVNQTQLNLLSKFHVDNLKRFQSLPIRTANCAVHLLLGALPIEGELHKRQLSLLYNILVSSNETITELSERQVAVNLENPLSYFCRVQCVLEKYQLPSLEELKIKHPSKDSWKCTVKEAVNKYWSELLKTEAQEKSTLQYLDINGLKIGETHPVWNSLDSIVSDVRKGTVKCRMLTGTYMLQSTSHKFKKATVSATCKCCGLYVEDLAHMLLECPAFIQQRKPLYVSIKNQVINCIGVLKWRELFDNRDSLVKLILDCSRYPIIKKKSEYKNILKETTELCYKIHSARIQKLSTE